MNYHILTVGNPNSGKTTLFNGLTGAKQQVGNWAGVTVEKKTGHYESHGNQFLLTDLPGIYALDSANDVNSLDEIIASSAVLNHEADVIINVVDVTCLERSLYMTLQLRELGRPMIVVLNKMDVLKRQRKTLNVKELEKVLGCPVLFLSANNTKQVHKFKKALHKHIIQGIPTTPISLSYGDAVEKAIEQISPLFNNQDVSSRALAIRALENDTLVLNTLKADQRQGVNTVLQQLNVENEIDFHIANCRYTFLHNLCSQLRQQEGELSRDFSEKVDKVLLNQWVGVPFFFLIMYVMFMFAINIGGAFIDFFDIGVGALLVDGGHYLLDSYLPVWLTTIIADGIGGGIQTVATFIPQIACLFLFLSVLESSGYMARAAFVLDKVMQKVGLPGKAFVPLVLGFGCNVPSIMATRTLEQERERKLAASMAPFMSCSARLPVYVLFASAFFPTAGQNVVFGLYFLGILAAIFTGLLLKHTIYPGRSDSFIMEIPNYELPTIRNVFIKTWQKLKRFVLGAGKTIVIVVTILSFFNSLGTDGTFGNEDSESSVLSKAAQVITPVFSPLGISEDNWPATVGIVTGIFAKEAVVGTLNSLYSDPAADPANFNLFDSLNEAIMSIPNNLVGLSYSDPLGIEVGDLSNLSQVAEDQGVENSIFSNLQDYFSTSSAMAYLILILLYTPCVAAMGAYVREFGRQYSYFIGGWTMLLAYVSATLYYQISNFSSAPMTSFMWIVISLSIMIGVYWSLKEKSKKIEHKVVIA